MVLGISANSMRGEKRRKGEKKKKKGRKKKGE